MGRRTEPKRSAVRVLIVDDHPVARDGVRDACAKAGMVVVGAAADGRSALALARALAPDVVVLDLVLPDMDGVAVVRQWRAEGNPVPVVVLTAHASPAYEASLRALGVRAFLGKETASTLVAALARRAVTSQGWLSAPAPTAAAASPDLTPQHLQILGLVAAGRRNREIAVELSLSRRTIEYHLRTMFERLEVDSRVELVSRAYQLGLLSSERPPDA